MGRWHVGWIAALAALSLSTQAAARQCNIELLPSIPVTMNGLRGMLWTRINGRKARFIIDTGAFWSMLSPAGGATVISATAGQSHNTGTRSLRRQGSARQGVTSGPHSV